MVGHHTVDGRDELSGDGGVGLDDSPLGGGAACGLGSYGDDGPGVGVGGDVGHYHRQAPGHCLVYLQALSSIASRVDQHSRSLVQLPASSTPTG
ncbi:MAG: hypothetical protein U5Q03_14950 [Bacteroidota bacterium]|nr:hypothetical protein [Bacteroidota bacterium]